VKIASYLAALVGLMIATVLIAWQGVGTLATSLAAAGWTMLLLGPLYLPVMMLDTRAWSRLLPRDAAPSFLILLRCTWISFGVNWLLPVAQVGGELVKARLIAQRGVAGAFAGASVVADKTVQATTQVAFALVGIGILSGLESGPDLVPAVVVFIALLAGLIYLFYCVQRMGLFRFLAGGAARFLRGGFALDLKGGAEALDRTLLEIYARRRDLLASAAWRLGGRFYNVTELWVALYLLGHPVSLVEALMLESLGQAVRGAAFIVPGALGVQEGGYILLGQLVGLGPEVSLSLSLMKRVRELMIGVPGLLAWQTAEGRLLWSR
jgi:putative membrane protein